MRFMLLLVGCTVGGLLLAFSLRGGSTSVLAPLFLTPLIVVVTRTAGRLETVLSSFVFGLNFYAVALEGLLGPLHGEFREIWIGLTLSYAIFQSAVCLLAHAILDKQQPVPFVESDPFGTQWLIRAGFIPVDAIRMLSQASESSSDPLARTEPFVPCICYDLFFPQTLRRDYVSAAGPIICSLDETFDGNGVFRQLSRIHTRLRAAELGWPVVRCSLGGLSGVWDANGRHLDPIAVEGKLMLCQVPQSSRPSIYRSYGDWFPVTCGIVTAVGVCWVWRPKSERIVFSWWVIVYLTLSLPTTRHRKRSKQRVLHCCRR